MSRIMKVCPYCGSDQVSKDATVRWSVEHQQWEISGIFDNGHCDGCDTELKSMEDEEVPEEVKP
jgi:uncharacterized protein with PIN domain